MARMLSIFLVLGLVLGVSGWIVAQDGGATGSGGKMPLDLPSGGTGDEEDEEDAPETITFYGAEFEGDGFFWCLDRSCSMGWNGEIDVLKQEAAQAINGLSATSELSLVSFATNYSAWSYLPVKASPAAKASAIGWVQQLQAGGWTCLAPAGVQTVQIANLSSKANRQMLFLGDGVPVCNNVNTEQECLSNITGANWQRIPINCVYISADTAGQAFFTTLAQLNGGQMYIVAN